MTVAGFFLHEKIATCEKVSITEKINLLNFQKSLLEFRINFIENRTEFPI